MEESQNTGTVTKDDSFQILQKVEDMIDYAYPLIKRWSVADKYAIGRSDGLHEEITSIISRYQGEILQENYSWRF